MNERRRRLITTTGTLLTVGLAGCAGDGPDDGDTDGNDATTSAETTPATSATTESTTTESTTTGGTQDTTTTTSDATVAMTIDNVGVRAWRVTSDESGTVAPLDENNPTLTFRVGRRYRVTNDGWQFHPFAFRATDDSPLLSQSASGRFEDDDAVDWVDDGGEFAFTMTSALAAAVEYYVCTAHAAMRGDVET